MILGHYSGSSTVDFVAWNSSGNIWSTVAGAFVASVDANVADYRLTATSIGGGVFKGTEPAGTFFFELRQRASLLSTSFVVDYDYLAASALPPKPNFTNTWYVRVDGNNANDGKSVESAKATFASAVTAAIAAGGTNKFDLGAGDFTFTSALPPDNSLIEGKGWLTRLLTTSSTATGNLKVRNAILRDLQLRWNTTGGAGSRSWLLALDPAFVDPGDSTLTPATTLVIERCWVYGDSDVFQLNANQRIFIRDSYIQSKWDIFAGVDIAQLVDIERSTLVNTGDTTITGEPSIWASGLLPYATQFRVRDSILDIRGGASYAYVHAIEGGPTTKYDIDRTIIYSAGTSNVFDIYNSAGSISTELIVRDSNYDPAKVADSGNNIRVLNTKINQANQVGANALATNALVDLQASRASKIDTIDTINAKTTNLPPDPADASDIAAAFGTVNSTLATVSSSLSTISGYIDTEVAAIKLKTDNLPVDPADASDIAAQFSSVASTLTAVQTALSTISGYVDTEVAAIKLKTDLIATNAADSPNAQTAQTTIASNLDASVQLVSNQVGTVQATQSTIVSNLSTVLASIGDFAASGVNNILGFLRALARSDATTPSDVGGTYDAASDSLQARADTPVDVDEAAIASSVVDALLAAGITGATINVTPLLANSSNPRYSTRDMAPLMQGSESSDVWTFVDAQGNPIDLTGKLVRVVFASTVSVGEDEDRVVDDTLVGAFKYETDGDGLILSDTLPNQVTLLHDASKTSTPGDYRFFWWNVTDKIPLAKGSVTIEPALLDVVA